MVQASVDSTKSPELEQQDPFTGKNLQHTEDEEMSQRIIIKDGMTCRDFVMVLYEELDKNFD